MFCPKYLFLSVHQNNSTKDMSIRYPELNDSSRGGVTDNSLCIVHHVTTVLTKFA